MSSFGSTVEQVWLYGAVPALTLAGLVLLVLLRVPTFTRLPEAFRRAREDGALVIVDVSARNPTLLDGKRVDPAAPPTLRSGMEIRLGDVSGTLLDARETHAALCRLPSPVRER